MKKWFTFCLILMLPILSAFSYEQKIVRLISEADDDLGINLYANLTKTGDLESIYFIDENKALISVDVEDLFSKEVLIFTRDGYDIFYLSCLKCSVQKGGKVKARYLYSGLWGSYRTTEMYLERDSSKKWALFTYPVGNGEREVIKSIYLQANYTFGKLVGIKDLLINEGERSLKMFDSWSIPFLMP